MFNKLVFSIWRLVVVSGNKRSYQDTGTKIVGTLAPVDAEFAALAGGAFGKSFKIFSDNYSADVRDNDRLKIGSEEYEVKGCQSFTNSLKHLEIVVEKAITQ